jgi:hypothetical protein
MLSTGSVRYITVLATLDYIKGLTPHEQDSGACIQMQIRSNLGPDTPPHAVLIFISVSGTKLQAIKILLVDEHIRNLINLRK